jgi:ubiquinone/menaquinone biosynthesis C-methylase UbiE
MAQRISLALTHWSLRRRQFDGSAATLDAMYLRPDPWRLANREQHRFEATNALIVQHDAAPESLLEIGCGEGFQTCHFAAIAGHVTGVDVSARAIARARENVPSASFFDGTLAAVMPLLPRRRYAIATLCEVLVYCPDKAGLIAAAQECADRVLVTTFEPQSRHIAPLCQGAGWQQLPTIRQGRKRWNVWLWTAPAA